MTSEIETPRPSFKWRKLLVQLVSGMLIGGLVGYGASYLAGNYADARGLDELPRSIKFAGLVALIYMFMSTVVLIGSVSPAVGSRLLNVEDADEIREMQSQFVPTGIAMLLWGAALLGLALSAPVGPLAPPVALAIGAGGLLIGTWFAMKAYRDSDELMLAMNIEAGAITYGLLLVVLGGWAMFAHVGYVVGPQPLDILTACYALVFVATFIAVGRRGMLRVR
jgi:hypothetical protein